MALFRKTFIKDFTKERYMALVRAYPRIKEEKTQRYIMLILTFLSLSFLGIFAISPTLNTIAELNKKLEDSEFVNNALKSKLNNLSSLNSQYESMASGLSAVHAVVPDTPHVPKLLAQVQSVAKDTGVAITNLQSYQVDLTKQKNTLQPVGTQFIFTLTAEGSLDSLLQFTKLLSTMDRAVTIESLNFTNEQKQRLTIRGSAYYLP